MDDRNSKTTGTTWTVRKVGNGFREIGFDSKLISEIH